MPELTASQPTQQPSRDQIAQKAYEMWLAEGCPGGRAAIHWRLAEQQLRTKTLMEADIAAASSASDSLKPGVAVKSPGRQTMAGSPATKTQSQQQSRAISQEPARW